MKNMNLIYSLLGKIKVLLIYFWKFLIIGICYSGLVVLFFDDDLEKVLDFRWKRNICLILLWYVYCNFCVCCNEEN